MAETSTPKEPVAAPDEAGNASQSINPESPADADASPAEPKPQLSFKVIHGKNSWDIVMPADSLVSDLKVKLAGVTGIHSHLQKLLWRGNLVDTKPLNACGLTPTSKVMMIASAVEDVLKVNLPSSSSSAAADSKPKETKQRWEHMTEHKKVIAKGVAEDLAPAPSGTLPIPLNGVTGLLNRQGAKTRLTFKTGESTLIISTNERTQKVPYDTIKAVTSEAISESFDGNYHILALQLGPTDKSNYYLYFVPGAYVQAIKDEILGEWQPFF